MKGVNQQLLDDLVDDATRHEGGCVELPQGRVSASVDAVLDKLLKTISPAMPDEADSGNF